MSLYQQLNHWVQSTPDSPAIVFDEQEMTFGQLGSRIEEVKAVLAGTFHITKGNRVVYLGMNHPDMIALLFACADLGAIFCPWNTRLAREEYNYLLRDAEPEVCFFDDNFAAMIPELDTSRCLMQSLDGLENLTTDVAKPPQKDVADAPLLLVYTSGTTGRPKGVLLSQNAVWANTDNCQALYSFAPGQKVQVTLPLFHVGGLCILLLPALLHGATIHLHAKFDPVIALADIEDNRITTSIFVPAQMAAMMALPDWSQRDLSSMDYVVVGSSIIPLEQIQQFHARGIPVSQVYGATETGPAAIGLEIEDAGSHEGSAGTPVKHCQIEVRKNDGTVCGPGMPGEIWVRGENILSGYWRNKDETAKVLVDGWYNTGDIGKIDADGFYWIVDRSKDVVISGGENIYPAEIEAVALQHPAITAIAVVGKADPHWGETPVAAVEIQPGHSLTLADLQTFLTDQIAQYKHPKSLLILDALPRNVMGKVEKSALRKMISEQTGQQPQTFSQH